MMKLADVKTKAKLVGISNPSADRTELIRQIQSYEGFFPCYKTKAACDQCKCCWKEECIKR